MFEVLLGWGAACLVFLIVVVMIRVVAVVLCLVLFVVVLLVLLVRAEVLNLGLLLLHLKSLPSGACRNAIDAPLAAFCCLSIFLIWSRQFMNLLSS